VTLLNNNRLFDLACRDVVQGIVNWRVWYMLGLDEIRQRYRRSSLGALWVTMNLAIQVAIMTLLLGSLFQQTNNRYLPHIAISLALWAFISGTVCESCSAFYGNSATILQIKRPLTTYVMHVMWRNAIIFGHNFLVFLVAGPISGVYPSFRWLILIPAFLLVSVVTTWMGLIAGILSTRFRDVPLIVVNIFNVLMWLTPVMYLPSQLVGGREILLWINPLSMMMQIMRGPMLGEDFNPAAWGITIALAIVGWAIALAILTRTRHRLTYWL